jgi:hypothetical protein
VGSELLSEDIDAERGLAEVCWDRRINAVPTNHVIDDDNDIARRAHQQLLVRTAPSMHSMKMFYIDML